MNGALFGSEDEEEEQVVFEDPPPYISHPNFKSFEESNKLVVNEKFGLVFIHTYKPFYFPGEIIRGSIVIDLFNPLPKALNEIKLRFSGREMVGMHF